MDIELLPTNDGDMLDVYGEKGIGGKVILAVFRVGLNVR